MGEKTDRRLIILAVFALVAVSVVVAVLIASGGGEESGGLAESCQESAVGAPNHLNLDCPDVETPAEGSVAVVDTSKGQFTIALATEEAPLTTASFSYMVDQELYTKTKFHRIVPDFVIQGGDPLGNGTGGPGYSVTEAPPPSTKYTPGVVAMAKAGDEPPGTSGSQFFVVTGAGGESLPAEYALLGEVVEGLDVVGQIGRLGTPSEQPKEPIFIDKITIEER
ncbi:MAG TPA: peptidylprolyl isomerase [Solirubrobacterales bacterium]|jgi:cyclophilin family peptidyl-prolyl cis-trans isomerase